MKLKIINEKDRAQYIKGTNGDTNINPKSSLVLEFEDDSTITIPPDDSDPGLFMLVHGSVIAITTSKEFK